MIDQYARFFDVDITVRRDLQRVALQLALAKCGSKAYLRAGKLQDLFALLKINTRKHTSPKGAICNG